MYVYVDTIQSILLESTNSLKRKRTDAIPEHEPEKQRRSCLFSLGDITVEMRHDGFVNATRMCKDGGKSLKHYNENQGAKDFYVELKKTTSSSEDDICVMYRHGRATFVHPDIAVHLAIWISPVFAISVSQLVRRYANGQATTEESQQMKEFINASHEKVPDSETIKTNSTAISASNDDRDILRLKLKQQEELATARMDYVTLKAESELRQQRLESKIECDRITTAHKLEANRLQRMYTLAYHQRDMAQQRLDFLVALWKCKNGP